jgi:hypothetical protein
MNFTSLDWAIVVSYLIASVSIGRLGKRYIGNVSRYLVAGRELGVYIGIATLAATEIGTITFMYNAELGYKYGFSAFAAALIVIIPEIAKSDRVNINTRFASKSGNYTSRRFAAATRPYQSPECLLCASDAKLKVTVSSRTAERGRRNAG